MLIVEENYYNSDDEIDKKKHNRLLNEVLQLDQRPIFKKPSRTEPKTHVSEFNLVKSVKNTIKLCDLTKVLKQKSKHAAIGNKIKSAQKAQTLHKPLEKPQAERIRRTVGFKKTKSDLNKWNSIVEKNRVASQISYPLDDHDDNIDFVDTKKDNFVKSIKRYKSVLDIELAKLEPKVETINVENKFPLSMGEIIQRRKEIAKLRAHQSYQEAKAHKKNKIKSKSYHRIKRKEKMKQQIKEFELLQKTDPEEALKKLEQLEKTRAEERMSLRHRSTGAWAKNKQIRAKYDKNSRQVLAQQLSLSRELTQKLKASSSDSETETEVPQTQIDVSNPWNSKSENVSEFINGYRKYWDERNQNIILQDSNSKTCLTKKDKIPQIITKNRNKSKTQVIHCNSCWTVTSISDNLDKAEIKTNNNNVEDIFDNLEYTVRQKTKKKLIELQNSVVSEKKNLLKNDYKEFIQKSNLIFKHERELRPDLDDELKNMNEVSDNKVANLLKIIENPLKENKKANIDPSKYIETKISKMIELESELPNISYEGDNTNIEDENQKHFIHEAFADDDVVSEFTKEKNDIIDQNKSKNINLILPGWGAWGGKNIQPSKRKKKRFIIKIPKDLPRRDQNKGHLIINELKSKQIKKHQVSEIPFPFTSVTDFEASIRAPIGDTFVPQTAFRRLIKPSIVTKKGAIIEPMTDTLLLKQKFSQHGFMINKK